MKLKFNINQIRLFFRGFLPSREILIVCILFYVLGIIFAFMNPDSAHLTFPGGMFLQNIDAKIHMPAVITFNYLWNQFVYFLGAVSLTIFLKNLILMILCIFSGVAIIPVIFIGLFMKMGTITLFAVFKMGFKGLLVILGSFHIYFEFLAAILAIEAFFNFYISFINSIRQRDVVMFKKNISNEFMPLILKIILLLAIASILEVFWSTWWVYISTHPYVSWYNFYSCTYSVLLR